MNNNNICTSKSLVLTILICFCTISTFSQDRISKTTNFWSHVEYGGGLGLSFGDGFFSGAISPNAVYRFNPYIATGVGLNFSYSSQKDVF